MEEDSIVVKAGGTPKKAAPPGHVGTKFRTPTVQEALPYTPLSSIVPFTPDIIQPPLALPRVTPSLLSSFDDHSQANKILDDLSSGADGAETASRRVQQTLQDVQRLLDPNSLTQFTFRRRQLQDLKITKPGKAVHPQKPQLSSFAKMVLDNTKVSYRYLTPESEPDVINSATKNSLVQHAQNPQAIVNGHGPAHPVQITPSSQQRKVAAIVPDVLPHSVVREYQPLPRVTSHDAAMSSGTRVVSNDQRQKGNLAVQNLQSLLTQIFDAKEQLDCGEYDALAASSAIFSMREVGDRSLATLSNDTQAKLDSSIAKVIANGRFQDINVDDLIRAEKLCATSMASVEDLSLGIQKDWNARDVEEWASRVNFADSGHLAARTLMRIITAGANCKELQSEDYIRELLQSFRSVLERCIIPVVEQSPFSGEKIRGEKAQPPANRAFEIAAANQKGLVSLMNTVTKNIRLLGDLLVKINLDGPSLSTVEYLCKSLIFAENAITQKESAVGIQNFEALRRCAMDVLAKVFTKYNDQRQFIFDEILVSLERLPATKQSARQYRLADSKPIQLVSALLMRLVQTSATKSDEALKLRSKMDEDEDEDADAEGSSESEAGDDDDENVEVSPSKSANTDLISTAKSLHQAAQSNAWYIVKVLTKRAATTAKNSDEPFRKLLDIFTEDFLNVLGSSDWPAAELLLRTLTMQMVQIAEGDKSSVPSRTLALELLGTMGAGILELQSQLRSTSRSIDVNESHTSKRLVDVASQIEAADNDSSELLAYQGPYRYIIQYLEARNTGDDAQLQTARGYHLTEWTWSAYFGRENSVESDNSESPRIPKELPGKLKQMFAHPKWLDEQGDHPTPSSTEGRLAAMLVTIRSPFCRAFDRIFATLISSINSDSPKVKSRSMASTVALLEKDPSILDRNQTVLGYILRGVTDNSPLVRDSALGLIDKCLTLRPELDASVYVRVIERTRDAGLQVRKRALKMLKEIHLRNQSLQLRLPIASAIVARIEDLEDSMIELARVTIEEIWFQPFYGFKMDGDRTIEAKVAFASQAALFIQTIESNDNMFNVLEALLGRLLRVSKTASANLKVCKMLVAALFDGIIDSKMIPGTPTEDQILLALTIFARASPELFTTSQLERLEPYTQNLTNTDDLDVYRSVITILRNVMPHQPMMNITTLKTLQTTLLTSVTRLQKPELREVAPCLWTIDNMLGDQGNKDRLPNFIISVLQKIAQMRNTESAMDDKTAATLAKLMRIVGEFGNACNFDSHLPDFRKRCTWASANSAAGLIVETLCPLTSPKCPPVIRMSALEAICTIAQAWPKQFLRTDVTNAFEIVFKDRIPEFEEVLLAGLEGFFVAQEVPDENEDGPDLGTGVSSGTERLGRTYVASDHDGASTALAQRFLSHFLRLSLASCDESAFISARLVISINKQGLVHPKESAPALVALETCPNKTVATESFKEHKSQFQKHESLFEKEYMRAVQQTLKYQQNVIGEAAGFFGSPPTSKMHLTWEVLKLGKAQIRKKFLGNLAQKLDFDPTRLDVSGAGLQHLAYVRFCLDNVAFFEYDKIDDLLHLVASLEKIFAGTGSTVAQAIESEVLKLQVDTMAGSDITGTSETMVPESTSNLINLNRLLQLALSSQILCLIWETRSLLHRLWNLQKHTNSKQKGKEKDSNRSAARVTNATSLTDSYLKRMGELSTLIDSEPAARKMCSNFVELISVDHEVKVGSEEDADGDLDLDGYGTPSEGTDRKSPSMPPSGGSRGRKRKGSLPNGTPRKKQRPSFGKKRSNSGKFMDEDDEEEDGDGWD